MPEYKKVRVVTGVGYEYTSFENDFQKEEDWYYKGTLHNVQGPARVKHFKDTGYTESFWAILGKRHRVDGPAWTKTGYGKCLVAEKWYLNEIEMDPKECRKVLECPLEELPLYINTEYAPIAKKRLSEKS